MNELFRYWEEQTGASLQDVLILRFPKNTLEGKFEIAQILSAPTKKILLVYAPNDEGGSRLTKIADEAGLTYEVFSKAHHKLVAVNTGTFNKENIEQWLEAGALQQVAATGYWSQPGLFSWDEIDKATKLLLENLPDLKGCGADFGCGYGALSIPLSQAQSITHIYAVDKDARAIEAYKKNAKGKVEALCLDIQKDALPFSELDFVVMNPPFHRASQQADIALGLSFFERAAGVLRAGGELWAVANQQLPYEAAAKKYFATLEIILEKSGYKVLKAIK
ncbi:MAG: methyltransferase [Alphaproteobacteria bacterium]|nr:methyltransferase [Alphaproteobacteria bacterium]